MLIKSLISKDEAVQLLDWTVTQNIYQHTSVGEHGFYSTLDELNNHPSLINVIRKKCSDYVDGVYQEPIYKDLANEVFINGYVQEHTDPTVKGYKHLRCNIMLQKPDTGGQIVFNGNPIDMDIGDMYIVDTSLPHGVSKVQGKVTYKTIVFGFLCNE